MLKQLRLTLTNTQAILEQFLKIINSEGTARYDTPSLCFYQLTPNLNANKIKKFSSNTSHPWDLLSVQNTQVCLSQ